MELMRRALLWASTNPWLSTRLPQRRFVRHAVRRFMPGEELADAVREAEKLKGLGVPTIITLLGENLETPEQTRAIVDEFRRAMDLGVERGLDVEMSVKPTHLGLDMDANLAFENISALASHTEGRGTLWIDMESTAYTDATLELFRALRERHANVGVCLQAYLHRTRADLDALLELGPRIRLVKGAYAEPAELAFAAKRDVDANYLSLAGHLVDHLAAGGEGFLALGTHDSAMVSSVREHAQRVDLSADRFEVEMLYGIGTREQQRLVRDGTRLRILISYGTAWFPWYMRRLAERPANVWFVVRSLVR